ncbi:ParA family protein [Stomatobaculum longum]|uniref:ParA family protein n=1 Tax=Stomatobaculum longum TaxID=796942 RepID=UPI0028E626A1|nr:AAA family ATPase [Stomatobaculum longum]
MKKIIALSNQKGGVGKTTTVVNLAAAFAEAGMRVLAVDFDPQGNLSSGLGIEKKKDDNTIYELLMDACTFEEAVHKSYSENLDVLTSNVNLSGLELELLEKKNREYVLKHYLEAVVDRYDYIFIDCPPSLSLLTINALTAATDVIIPIQCEYYAMEGLNQMLRSIKLLQMKLNPALRINGIVFTMYDARNNLSQQVVDSVKDVLKEYIYDTVIARNVRIAESPSYGMPVTEYDPRSTGAENYRKLAAEILMREAE